MLEMAFTVVYKRSSMKEVEDSVTPHPMTVKLAPKAVTSPRCGRRIGFIVSKIESRYVLKELSWLQETFFISIRFWSLDSDIY